jgi:hypothetical protein
MKLTRAAVQAIMLPSSKAEAIFFDDEIPGFGLRLGVSISFFCPVQFGKRRLRGSHVPWVRVAWQVRR